MSVKNLVRSEPVGATTPVKFLLLSSRGGAPAHLVNVTFIVAISVDGDGALVELANGKSVPTAHSVHDVAARLMDHRLLV